MAEAEASGQEVLHTSVSLWGSFSLPVVSRMPRRRHDLEAAMAEAHGNVEALRVSLDESLKEVDANGKKVADERLRYQTCAQARRELQKEERLDPLTDLALCRTQIEATNKRIATIERARKREMLKLFRLQARSVHVGVERGRNCS